MKKYGILCGSRSGSTYLCDLLLSTNRCGKPQEFFNKSLNFTTNKHQLLHSYKTANDVFGAKIVGMPQLNDFGHSGISLTHWIWLYREDSVLQAISRYIAFTTNGWHKQTELPEYSYDGIAWCLDEVNKENEYFGRLFTQIPHLKLSYETDICDNPEQTIISILHYLNITTEELPKIKSVHKLTDHVNYTWKSRFNEENRA